MARRRVFQVGNVCALCEETYPRSTLYRCYNCGMLYCGNCVTLENGKIICLKCAVKRIFPRSPRNKYAYLSMLLARKAKFQNKITFSFAEIEGSIGEKLPKSAYERKDWWSNVRGRSPSETWLTVGWRVSEVNLKEKTVTFIKDGNQPANELKVSHKHDKYKSASPKFKSLAVKVKVHLKKPRGISKSKIAILQARLKNIERLRLARKYRGKNPYEKRLYRSKENLS
ncbi:MAG: hypothetical protein QXG34_02100 [Candidatus Bathyarchaeia archaeon]